MCVSSKAKTITTASVITSRNFVLLVLKQIMASRSLKLGQLLFGWRLRQGVKEPLKTDINEFQRAALCYFVFELAPSGGSLAQNAF